MQLHGLNASLDYVKIQRLPLKKIYKRKNIYLMKLSALLKKDHQHLQDLLI